MIKTKAILVKVSPEEKELIIAEAKKVGMNVSAFIRLLIRNWSNGITFERDKGTPQ